MVSSNMTQGDELDRQLRTFFQAEMPNPWPSLQSPLSRPAVLSTRLAPPSPSLPWNSRYALAASVAVLISGSFLLSGRFHPDAPRPFALPVGGEAQATRPGTTLKLSGFEIIEEDVKPVLGPKVRITPIPQPPRKSDQGVRAIAKPSRESVRVLPVSLDDGKLKIVVEYYPKGAEKAGSLTCQGSVAEIEKAIQAASELTAQQKEQARLGLERVRSGQKPRDGGGSDDE